MHDKDKCIFSQECFKVCPEVEVLHMIGQISMPVVKAECIKCGRCVEACENDALNFSVVSLTKQIRGEL